MSDLHENPKKCNSSKAKRLRILLQLHKQPGKKIRKMPTEPNNNNLIKFTNNL